LSIETKDVDKGYKALIKQLRLLDNKPYVKVGFPKEGIKTHESGESLALIASVQEFGTQDGRIPERSFLRSTADEKRKEVNSIIDSGLNDIIKQKTTVQKLLDKIGIFGKGATQQKITDISSPPNKSGTISKKGSSNPLVDQGFMRQSVGYEVKLGGTE
jgi:hypothetical protein